jgi:myo-inositol 2-dehydrogenase / D-chiro-inositol 1-dehydrogenase
LGDAYTAEFVEYIAAIQQSRQPYATGQDARRALAVALACIESVQTCAPISIDRSVTTLER